MNNDIILNRNNLLTFLINPNIYKVDKFYSGQPYKIYIPFEEYLQFVNDFIEADLGILRISLDTYKKHLQNISNLKRLYMYDLSCIILEEVFAAQSIGLECTRVFSRFNDLEAYGVISDSFLLDDINNLLFQTFNQEQISTLLTHAKEHCNLNMYNENISSRNRNMFSLGVYFLGAYMFGTEGKSLVIKEEM